MFQKQNQTAGKRATLLQAGRDIHVGITASEGRQIALDVFKANALELAGVAKESFEMRGREFIERYLEELQKRRPEAVQSFARPDMQHALFMAQLEAAKSGDEEIAELLVDILVERAAEEKRNIKRIVLDEALAVAPKLTAQETCLLSIAFLLDRVSSRCESLGALQVYICQELVPFFDDLPDNMSSFYHLLYTGCASPNDGQPTSISAVLYHENRHLFCSGLTGEEVRSISPDAIGTPLVIPWLQDPSLYQTSVVPYTIDEIEQWARRCGLPSSEVESLVSFQLKRMRASPEDARTELAKLVPELSNAIERWDASGAERMELTTVGVAIAIANIRRKTGQKFDLGEWMP